MLEIALVDGSSLRNYLKTGMGAFARVDVGLIARTERTKIGDSIDLDAASRPEFPEENRWDYMMSLPATSEIVGLEPHTARDSEICVVISKRKHALAYLRSHLRAGHHVAKWFWVSHGPVGFSRMERARRLLDQNGIEFAGRLLRTLG